MSMRHTWHTFFAIATSAAMIVSLYRASEPGCQRKAVYGRPEILHSRDMGILIIRR